MCNRSHCGSILCVLHPDSQRYRHRINALTWQKNKNEAKSVSRTAYTITAPISRTACLIQFQTIEVYMHEFMTYSNACHLQTTHMYVCVCVCAECKFNFELACRTYWWRYRCTLKLRNKYWLILEIAARICVSRWALSSRSIRVFMFKWIEIIPNALLQVHFMRISASVEHNWDGGTQNRITCQFMRNE